ncbi:hypothetical protein MK079_01665 [Candidatus Gracilibacteria bacterium]|nr:hypothetical protein [Candidatus Gracilibacteria bacterium]
MTNTPGNNSESGVEKNKKKEENLDQIFVKEFLKKGFQNKQNANQFIQDIKDAKNIKDIGSHLDYFFQSYENLRFKDIYDEVYKNTLFFKQIQSQLTPYKVSLDQKKQHIYALFLRDFDIPDVMIDNQGTFQDILFNRSLDEIESYTSQVQRKQLIQEIFPDQNLFKQNKNPLDNILPKGIWEKLTAEQQREYNSIQANFRMNGYLTAADYEWILEIGILKGEELEQFIYLYIPSISFQKAIKVGVISSSAVDKIIQKVLQNSFDDSSSQEAQKFLEDFKNGQFEDFDISTRYIHSPEQLSKLAKKIGFGQAEQEGKQDYEEALSNGPQNMDEFIVCLEKDFSPIGVDTLKKSPIGSVLCIQREKNGKQETLYVRVDDMSLDGEGKISLEILGSGSNILNSGDTKNIAYNQLISNFQEDAQKGLSKVQKLQIFSDQEFQKYVSEEENGITQNVSDFEPLKDDTSSEEIGNINSQYIRKLQDEIDELEQGLDQIPESHHESRKIKEDLIKRKREKIDQLDGDQTIEQANFYRLLDTINTYDPQGAQLGLGNNVALFIQSKDPSKRNGVFFIEGIDEEKSQIQVQGEQPLTLNIF